MGLQRRGSIRTLPPLLSSSKSHWAGIRTKGAAGASHLPAWAQKGLCPETAFFSSALLLMLPGSRDAGLRGELGGSRAPRG